MTVNSISVETYYIIYMYTQNRLLIQPYPCHICFPLTPLRVTYTPALNEAALKRSLYAMFLCLCKFIGPKSEALDNISQHVDFLR
jgi:hypothetical protein